MLSDSEKDAKQANDSINFVSILEELERKIPDVQVMCNYIVKLCFRVVLKPQTILDDLACHFRNYKIFTPEVLKT